jgi:hypothetical protein
LDPFTGNQAVYVAYVARFATTPGIRVAGSNDGGATFTKVQVTDLSRARQFADPAVGPNGELYVSWHEQSVVGTINLKCDLDGIFASTYSFGDEVLVRELERSMFRTLGVPAQPDRGIHTGPVIDVDRSGGTYNGRLYLTWVDAVDADTFDSTDNSDIFLAWSDNNGESGSWVLPGSIGNVENSSGTDFLPWIDVDQVTGSVNLLYYTTDGDQGVDEIDNDDVHVRFASSVNGGDSFTPATMSRHTSNEFDGYNGDYLEYIGLAVHGGTAHALWASRLPAGGVDLEALYASASIHSAVGDNVLTITGDDSGSATNDTILVERPALTRGYPIENLDYLIVTVNGVIQYAGLMATVNRIEINSLGGDDTIVIDSGIDADFLIHGGDGTDDVTLFGNGASALGKFELHGDAGNDDFIIDFENGDALPRPGFEFNFIGGAGEDNVSVIDSEGTHTGYFVNTPSDAVDNNLSDGRADSSGAADDQTTLRAAIQEANQAATKTYVFLPTGLQFLMLGGSGGDDQGDLDITGDVTVVGSGAGASYIYAASLATDDRIFDVTGKLEVSRLTLTLGDTQNGNNAHGGAIRVQNGGHLELEYSAIVDNETGSSNLGGGIYFASGSTGAIEASVITMNTGDEQTGGIYLADGTGTVTLKSTIVANNNLGESTNPDIHIGSGRTLQSLGDNRLTSGHDGHFTRLASDYILQEGETVHYVVTSVVDAYDGSDHPISMTLRDAIHQANITAGVQEIWLPAWNFILTSERIVGPLEEELLVSQGDLEITESLLIRVTEATKVAWRSGAARDKVFELIGDFDGDYDVDNADNVVWDKFQGQQAPNLPADADDDGDVDEDDETLREVHYGEQLELLDVA